jgi:hypothetical protein
MVTTFDCQVATNCLCEQIFIIKAVFDRCNYRTVSFSRMWYSLMYLQQLDYFIKRNVNMFYNSSSNLFVRLKFRIIICRSMMCIAETHIFSNVVDGEIRIFFNIIISVTLKWSCYKITISRLLAMCYATKTATLNSQIWFCNNRIYDLTSILWV